MRQLEGYINFNYKLINFDPSVIRG